MDEDRLVSAVSLPMWFPPVKINGDTYIDAVYITDANVEEAIDRGADEIWAIWTVSTRDEWRPGFVAQYFHIIETAADTNFFTIWERIKKNNDEIAAGRTGEFGRTIKQHLIQEEVRGSLLLQLLARPDGRGRQPRRRDGAQVVPRQRHPARRARHRPAALLRRRRATTSLQFTEDMRGFLGAGATDLPAGYDLGKQQDDLVPCASDDPDRRRRQVRHRLEPRGRPRPA